MMDKTWPPRTDEQYLQEVVTAVGAELAARLGEVQSLIFDADGVLTPGNLLYGSEGEALKEFDSRDGLGLVMARVAGLKLGVLTGRQSEIVGRRAQELRFDSIRLGRFDKLVALWEMLAEIDSNPEQTLYMGDDVLDLPVLFAVGMPVAVPGAPAEVRHHCRYTTAAPGGRGAVREVVDLVLKSRRIYGLALERLAQKIWPVQPGGGR